MIHLLIPCLLWLPTMGANHSYYDQRKTLPIIDCVREQEGLANLQPAPTQQQKNHVMKKRHSLALLLLLMMCGGSWGYSWHNHTLASLQNAHLQTSCQNLEKGLQQSKQLHTDMVHTVATLREENRVKDHEVAQKLTALTNQLDQTSKSCALMQDKVADLGDVSKKLERDLGLIDTALQATTRTLDDQHKEMNSFHADAAARDARYKADLEKLRVERLGEMALFEQRITGSLQQYKEKTKARFKEQLDDATKHFTQDMQRQEERHQALQRRFDSVCQERDTQESIASNLRAQRDKSHVQLASSALKIAGTAADWYADRRKQKKQEQDQARDEELQERFNTLNGLMWPEVPTHEPGTSRSHVYQGTK